MIFSQKLKQLREREGLSQEKLAERLSVSRQVITKWENGTGTPKIENLKAIADCFHVSVDELLGRTEASDKDLAAQYRMTIEELRLHSEAAIQLLDRAITLGSRMSQFSRDNDSSSENSAKQKRSHWH